MRKKIAVASLLAVMSAIGGRTVCGQSSAPAIAKAEASIDAARIREQDKFLSDDLFEGRYPGLRGGELAAKYIATQFALEGLKPAGDNGTFFQQVNFVGMKVEPLRSAPGMTGQNRQRGEIDPIGERGAGLGKDFLERPAHGEDGRPGVDPRPADRDFPHLAARRTGAFEQRHLEAARCEQDGADQAADTGADDNHAPRRRRSACSLHSLGPKSADKDH